MNRIDYLRKALEAKNYRKQAWIITAFAITREGDAEYLQDPYPYRLVQKPTGFYYVDPNNNNELVKINDAKPDKPLFRFLERITVDKSFAPNCDKPVESTVGNILANLIILVESVGTKVPFITGRFNINKIGNDIGKRLREKPVSGEPEANAIYVDELVRFYDARPFITGLSQLCTWSATEKNVLAPEGNAAFNKQLRDKYAGKTGDPTVLAAMQKEWRDFDAQQLKGDPTAGRFISGKILTARMKMFNQMGKDISFADMTSSDPILTSLEEGLPLDAKYFPIALNAQRYGSYARGSLTVYGGVALKKYLQALSAIKIIPGDCGTKLGELFYVTKNNFTMLSDDDAILEKGEWKPFNSYSLADLQGKLIVLRSPTHCKANPGSYCAACMGEGMSRRPDGTAMTAAESSSIILGSFMGLMHSKQLQVAVIATADSLS